MQLYYAHYPALEDYFVRFVRTHRFSPTAKWGVICASSWLAQRLQIRLARELGAWTAKPPALPCRFCRKITCGII